MSSSVVEDFKAIRERLEQLRKEQEENPQPQQQQEPQADTYAEYEGCVSSNQEVSFYREYTMPAYQQYIKALSIEFKL